jgi:hypothetical protein
MVLWSAAILSYLLVAGFAWAMCGSEQRRMGGVSMMRRGASFLACLAWPATLIVMIIAVRLQASSDLLDIEDDASDPQAAPGLGQWREA